MTASMPPRLLSGTRLQVDLAHDVPPFLAVPVSWFHGMNTDIGFQHMCMLPHGRFLAACTMHTGSPSR